MSDAFELPLSVSTGDGEHLLVLRAAAPVPWTEAAPLIAAAAGLPPTTPLHLGWSPPPPESAMGLPPLLAGLHLTVDPQPPAATRSGLVLDCSAGPDAGRSTSLDSPVVIGRSPAADLTLADPEVSARHARLIVGDTERDQDAGAVARDLCSTNGIRTLGRPAPPDGLVSLTVGEPFRIGGSVLRVDLPAAPPLLRHPDGRGHWSVALPAHHDTEFTVPVPAAAAPPPADGRRRIPVLTALLTAGVGIGIAAVTGLWMFLLMAVLGPVTMIAAALGDRASDRRPRRRALADHRRDQARFAAEVAAAVVADRADAWERFADPARLIRWATDGSVRLWQQRLLPDAREFTVTIAVGSRPVRWAPGTGRPGATPSERVADVPLDRRVPAAGVLGICGTGRGTVRWLLAQWMAGHPPSRLRMQILGTADDLACLRDIPHAGGRSAVVPDPSMLDLGPARNGRQMVVLDDVATWRTHPAIRRLLDHRDPALLVVAVARNRSGLPEQCTAVIDTDGLPGEPIGIAPVTLAELARALTPLTVTTDAALPHTVLAPAVDGPELLRHWTSATRAVFTLGTAAGGTPLQLDLDADGPHLLVAGTTGAGKSELLQTLVAGLATALPPNRLSLLLIDYKGGAAFGAVARLPHTSGLVTDLDGRLSARALRSLRAEIRSRETALVEAGVVDLASWVARDPVAAPPRLVIVVDEFAALAAELPEFLEGLVDVARRGRSLGLHLVLATQRPAGVVGPAVTANMAARICLRVTDPADSTDVIGTPVAATIGADTPGRAFLRTAGGVLTEFQTARVTAPTVDRVTVRPRGVPAAPDHGPVPLQTLIEHAGAATVSRPAPPWLPPLPDRWEHHDPDVLGLADLPDTQIRRAWRVPATSLLIGGPPASGRSTALRRWAAAVIAGGGRTAVVDSGGPAMVDDGILTATDTALDLSEPTLVLRLFELLDAELHHRRLRPGPPLGLIVDGWEPMVAVLDQIDYGSWLVRFCELAGRGPAVGIRVAVAGDVRALQHRVAASFGSRLALGLPDALGVPTPGVPPGRGSTDDGTEVQVASPGRRAENAPVVDGAGSSGPGVVVPEGAVVVRPLPPMVAADLLPPARAACVPVGLGGDAAGPVGFDLSGPGGGLMIAGPRRSGVSQALQLLAAGAAAARIPTVRLVSRSVGTPAGVRDLELRDDGRPLLELLADHHGPLVLLADDADRWVDHPAGGLLVRFLRLAGEGQFLLLGCRLDRALRSLRGPIAETAASRTGILLGADAADGTLLDVTLPRRRVVPPPGRGVLVRSGVPVPVQVAGPPPAR